MVRPRERRPQVRSGATRKGCQPDAHPITPRSMGLLLLGETPLVASTMGPHAESWCRPIVWRPEGSPSRVGSADTGLQCLVTFLTPYHTYHSGDSCRGEPHAGFHAPLAPRGATASRRTLPSRRPRPVATP